MKAAISWSGGKDSALALYEILKREASQIDLLITTISKKHNRVSMHGVRKQLLLEQVKSLGFPVKIIALPVPCSNEEYAKIMKQQLKELHKKEIKKIIFGDIFLEDIRVYREENMGNIDMELEFPLWNHNTHDLALKFIRRGFKSIITCVDSQFLDKRYIGKQFNHNFLKSLPENVDPCGEHGEFHTFVYDGPIFNKRIHFEAGKVKCEKDRFYFIELNSK